MMFSEMHLLFLFQMHVYINVDTVRFCRKVRFKFAYRWNDMLFIHITICLFLCLWITKECLLFTIEMLSTVCESLPEEGSVTRVTGSTVEGTNNLHFFVHERGKHIQIGQCCLIAEIHVNDQMMEELRAKGHYRVSSTQDRCFCKSIESFTLSPIVIPLHS